MKKINSGRDDFENYKNSFENTIKMMFRQSSGVPSSLHGFFLRHHIEALTIQGIVTRKTVKHNSLRLIRFFHSFFFHFELFLFLFSTQKQKE